MSGFKVPPFRPQIPYPVAAASERVKALLRYEMDPKRLSELHSLQDRLWKGSIEAINILLSPDPFAPPLWRGRATELPGTAPQGRSITPNVFADYGSVERTQFSEWYVDKEWRSFYTYTHKIRDLPEPSVPPFLTPPRKKYDTPKEMLQRSEFSAWFKKNFNWFKLLDTKLVELELNRIRTERQKQYDRQPNTHRPKGWPWGWVWDARRLYTDFYWLRACPEIRSLIMPFTASRFTHSTRQWLLPYGVDWHIEEIEIFFGHRFGSERPPFTFFKQPIPPSVSDFENSSNPVSFRRSCSFSKRIGKAHLWRFNY